MTKAIVPLRERSTSTKERDKSSRWRQQMRHGIQIMLKRPLEKNFARGKVFNKDTQRMKVHRHIIIFSELTN